MKKTILALIAATAVNAWAGPNQDARVYLDLNPTVPLTAESIDSVHVTQALGEEFDAVIVADAVANLDTYAFRLVFDGSRLALVDTGFSYKSQPNILAASGKTCVGLGPLVREGVGTDIDTIVYPYSLSGTDEADAPEGFGIVGYARFAATTSAGDSTRLSVESADLVGSDMQSDAVAPSNLSGATYEVLAPGLPMPCNLMLNVEPPEAQAAGCMVSEMSGPPGMPPPAFCPYMTSVTAFAPEGWRFVRWTGGASGTEMMAPVDVDGPTVVTGHFASTRYSYTLTVSHMGNGVAPSTGAVDMGGSVTITAMPGDEYSFVKWTVQMGTATFGDSTLSQTTMTPSSDVTVQAVFRLINKPPVVSDIPDQNVAYGASFTKIQLDEFVSDADNTDAQML